MGATPIAYLNDRSLGLSLTVIEGTISAEEWHAHVLAQMADPDWPAGSVSLTEALRAVISDQARAAIHDMAALYAPKKDRTANMRFAIVANKAFSDARAFEEAVEPHGVRPIVFNDVQTACTWLGVDAHKVQALVAGLRASMRRHRA